MSYLLDSNACIVYLNGRAPRLRDRLHQTSPSEIYVCSVVKTELFFGSLRSNNPAANLVKQRSFLTQFISLPFDDQAAEHCAQIRAHLADLGQIIGPNDLLIAAIALANNLTLVTDNTSEFQRVPGLKCENWQE